MKKGEVYLVELSGGRAGHEQSGMRPAVVVGAGTAGIVTVVPVTSNMRASRFSHTVTIRPSKTNGLTKESVALVFHIRSVDSKRLKRRKGVLSAGDISKVNSVIKTLLKI